MAFLNFWREEKDNIEGSASQLDLSGNLQELIPPRERVTGAIVFKRFNKAIKDNGGAGDVYPDAIAAETDELFGCNVEELYRGTGGKSGRRDTLPQPAQEAYMVNESLTANELERLIGYHWWRESRGSKRPDCRYYTSPGQTNPQVVTLVSY